MEGMIVAEVLMSSSQKNLINEGFVNEVRIRKHNTESIQNHNCEVRVKLLHIISIY
jgi:hypothetical protein